MNAVALLLFNFFCSTNHIVTSSIRWHHNITLLFADFFYRRSYPFKATTKNYFSKYLLVLHEHLCQMCSWWWKTLVLNDLNNLKLRRTDFIFTTKHVGEKMLVDVSWRIFKKYVYGSSLSNHVKPVFFFIGNTFVISVHAVLRDILKNNF